MSDPGTTYRTREEIQNMRSSNDAIQGLKSKLLEWGVVNENELKELDKQARKKVDDEVAEAEKSPERIRPPFPSPPPIHILLISHFPRVVCMEVNGMGS
jgi:TPP-dependent pyruvate/acetoin dehydrogenase alpha subunit